MTLFREGLRREHLPEAPPETPRTGTRPALVAWLFAPEPLPLEPERPPRKGGSLLRQVLAREPLPQEPPRPPRAGAGRPWLAWLLFPEKLDPPAPPGDGPP
jgi:hypothetical protein